MAQPAKQRGRKQPAPPPPARQAGPPATTQEKPLEKIKRWLGTYQNEWIQAFFGNNLAAYKRFVSYTVTAITKNKSLQTCDLKTLFLALAYCAQRGLEPGVEDGAYLVPYKGKVTVVPAYRGLIKQGKATGSIIDAEAILVYEGEEVVWVEGENPKFEHTPAPFGQRGENRKVVGGYARIWLPGRDKPKCIPMDYDEIVKRRDSSAAWRDTQNRESTPWFLWEKQMMMKTCLKNGFRFIPVAPDFRDLLLTDNQLEGGAALEDVVDLEVMDMVPEGERQTAEPATKTEALASKLAGEKPEGEEGKGPEVSGEEYARVGQEEAKEEKPQISKQEVVNHFQQRAEALGVSQELLSSFKLASWDEVLKADDKVLVTVDKYLQAHEAKAPQT